MGNKWSTTAITGYGSNDPPDDGTAVVANKVTYNSIKTNLTNPINSSLTVVISKLDDLFSNGTAAKSGTYTTTTSDHTRVLECTSTFTLTLLAAATAGAGYTVTVKNAGTGVITVARDSTDTIDGGTTHALQPKESATYTVNSGGDGYNVSGKGITDFTKSNTGHLVLQGNILVNWARLPFAAAVGPSSASWSKAFSGTPYAATVGRTLDSNAHVDLSTFSTTSIGATLSTSATGTVYVIAIGPA